MEENWKPRNNPVHLSSIDFWQGHQDNPMEKEYSFQQLVLGQLDIHMQRMNLDPYSHNIQKLIQNESET